MRCTNLIISALVKLLKNSKNSVPPISCQNLLTNIFNIIILFLSRTSVSKFNGAVKCETTIQYIYKEEIHNTFPYIID